MWVYKTISYPWWIFTSSPIQPHKRGEQIVELINISVDEYRNNPGRCHWASPHNLNIKRTMLLWSDVRTTSENFAHVNAQIQKTGCSNVIKYILSGNFIKSTFGINKQHYPIQLHHKPSKTCIPGLLDCFIKLCLDKTDNRVYMN